MEIDSNRLVANSHGWIGVHCFHNGDLDEVILYVIAPTIASLLQAGVIDRLFFLRYGEGGPHIRLRLRISSRDKLSELQESIATLEAELRDRDGTPKVIPVEYHPETERYGGPDALIIAEDHFHQSTLLALDALKRSRGRPAVRALMALQLMVSGFLAFGFPAQEIPRFFDAYSRATGRAVPISGRAGRSVTAKFDCFFKGDKPMLLRAFRSATLSEPDVYDARRLLVPWSSALRQTANRLRELEAMGKLMIDSRILRRMAPDFREKSLAYILSNYIHMMNNRLGVHFLLESYLAFSAAECAGESARFVERNAVSS